MDWSLTEPLLSVRVMAKLWKRMVSIYGHKWSSHLGDAMDGVELSDAAQTWRKGLVGVSTEQIASALSVLVLKNHEWPPSLPEFRRLCLSGSAAVPGLDQVVSLLVTVSAKSGCIAKRYEHPLVYAIALCVDMHGLRTAKAVDARRMVKPVYERLVRDGWPDFPSYALDEPVEIAHQPVLDRDLARRSVQSIRALCG